jgi:DNA-directed RNA polymerase subunit RPC12/RpoP
MYTLIKSVMKKSQISPISLTDLLFFYRQIRCRELTTTEADEPVRFFAQKQKERDRTQNGSSIEALHASDLVIGCLRCRHRRLLYIAKSSVPHISPAQNPGPSPHRPTPSSNIHTNHRERTPKRVRARSFERDEDNGGAETDGKEGRGARQATNEGLAMAASSHRVL